VFKWSHLGGSRPGGSAAPQQPERFEIPTVKLDPARWTDTVKADLHQNIKALEDVVPADVDTIYEDALKAFRKGFDLHSLCKALMARGMAKKRANEVARSLSLKTSTLMDVERLIQHGVEYAKWMKVPNIPCGNAEQDAAHAGASGQQFPIKEGLLINGKRTWPGREDGCKCSMRPTIKGFI
jgi:hypothetical protein